MRSLSWLSACLVAGGMASGPAWGQPAATAPAASAPPSSPAGLPGRITLRAALDAAWQRAVAAREADGQQRRAEADRAAAASPWPAPPALVLSHRDDRLQSSAGRRETEIGVAMALWLPGQKLARAGTAEAAAAQALAIGAAARLRLAGELRDAAWQVAALQAEAVQADRQHLAMQQLADDVVRRVRSGDLARADALVAQAEQLAAAALQSEARQRLLAGQARWALLTGQPAAPDLQPVAADDASELAAAVASASAPASAAAAATHPELQLAQQSTELARKRVELMRHSRRDAPELTLGLRHDVPGRAESAQGSLVVGLRLPLGTDARNRPLEVAALTELDVAETHEQRLRERLDSDIAAAREAHRAAGVQLGAEATRAKLLRERAALIDQSFRAGESPLPDLLRALAAAAQADSAAARQTAALGHARARLEQALGLLP